MGSRSGSPVHRGYHHQEQQDGRVESESVLRVRGVCVHVRRWVRGVSACAALGSWCVCTFGVGLVVCVHVRRRARGVSACAASGSACSASGSWCVCMCGVGLVVCVHVRRRARGAGAMVIIVARSNICDV
jgi:hypothetical protein